MNKNGEIIPDKYGLFHIMVFHINDEDSIQSREMIIRYSSGAPARSSHPARPEISVV